MHVIETDLQGVVILEPQIFGDHRGYFFESFSQREFAEKVCETVFVQDNESKSSYGVLRGLHYQLPPHAQSKLVRVIRGTVIDVAVDIRRESPCLLYTSRPGDLGASSFAARKLDAKAFAHFRCV